jgi:phage gpG-like protein
MSGIQFSGDIRRLTRQLKKLEDFDTRSVNVAIGETLKSSTVQRFDDQEDPEGKPWIPSIRAKEEDGKTLVNKGLYKRSIKYKADSREVAIGTNKKQARTLQLGDEDRVIRSRSSRGLRFRIGNRWITKHKVVVTIKPRAHFGISEDDMREIEDILLRVVSDN